MSRVLVIIPAYNEEATIDVVLDALAATVPEFDVVVVDDGSHDQTGKRVQAHEGVRLLTLPYNLGIGGAMQTGYKFAWRNSYDIAVQCDADGQHPVEQLHEIVGAVAEGRADLAIGSRYVADTGYQPELHPARGQVVAVPLDRFAHRRRHYGHDERLPRHEPQGARRCSRTATPRTTPSRKHS